MVTRIISAAILSMGLCALSSAAYAQGTSTPAQDPNAKASAAAPSDKASGKTTHHRAKKAAHRARASGMHDRVGGMHDGMQRGMHDQDSAYRRDLRHCVEGAEAQRDSCLDQAIAQHGHR